MPSAACGGSVSQAAARRAASLWGRRTSRRASTAVLMRSRIFFDGKSAFSRRPSISPSAHAEKAATRLSPPWGKRRARATSSAPASSAARASTASVKPSNGIPAAPPSAPPASRRRRIWARLCFALPWGWPCARSFLGLLPFHPVASFAFEDQLRQIVHALGIEDAVQMIELVLDHAGVEAARACARSRCP